jgi:putative redox protein
MAHAKAAIASAHYTVSIDADGHKIVADEPKQHGGENAGPAPYDLLLGSLAACTLITLRMYADRKQWAMAGARAELHYIRDTKGERIRRKLRFDGELTEDQRARLVEIAEKTPVTLTLKRGLSITTELDPPLASQHQAGDVDKRLDEALDESFPASDSPRVDP